MANVPEPILARARSFVDGYRVVDEQERDGRLVLVVEGDVATGRLSRALGDPAPPPPGAPAPAVAVEVSHEGVVRGTRLHAARAVAPGGPVEIEAWGFGADADAARANARAEAEARAAGAARGGFEITLDGVDSPVVLELVRAALAERIPGVARAALARAARGRFAFRVESSRSPSLIAAALAGVAFDGFHLELRALGPSPRLVVVSP